MKLSKDRILTTHVGSLPRSEKVFKLVFAKEAGEKLDKQEYEDVITDAVQTVVNKQQKQGLMSLVMESKVRSVMLHTSRTV